MRYKNVYLEAFAYSLPDEVVTSAELEARLAPLYRRLRLPEGRLEMMSGVAARRFWPPGMPPSLKSSETAEKAIQTAGIDRRKIGALVHGSVCRDFVEPATACLVHRNLGLPRSCAVYDVSNACLGLLNALAQVADMIELGQIQAGIVVGTENSRALVETTIAKLNSDTALSRRDIKQAFASLTIGSGSAAILLCHRELSRTGNRLLGGIVEAFSDHCELCYGNASNNAEEAVGIANENVCDEFAHPLMWTDSEALMQAGIAAAKESFSHFLTEVGWKPAEINKTFCHQVGRAHRRLLFETLKLDPAIDFSTLEELGNTGAVALPLTAAIGIERSRVQPGDRVALLGIGSGINVIMLGLEWHRRLG